MLRTLKFIGITLALLIVGVVAGVWIFSRFVGVVATKTGLPGGAAQGPELPTAPQSIFTNLNSNELEVFRPLQRSVVHDPHVVIEGKMLSTRLFLVVNEGEPQPVTLSPTGDFTTTAELKAGINQLVFVGQNAAGRLILKEVVVGYTPGEQGENQALLGQLKIITPQQSRLELATRFDTFDVRFNSATDIRSRSEQGAEAPLALPALSAGQRAGIIATTNDDGGATANEIVVGPFAHHFAGSVLEQAGSTLKIGVNGIETRPATLLLDGATRFFRWRDAALETLRDHEPLQAGQAVYVNGSNLPDQPTTTYHTKTVVVW